MAAPKKTPAPQGPAMRRVESSSLTEIGHAGDTLRATFKNGRTYEYKGVTPAQFSELLRAESIGKQFQALVLKNYTGKLVK